MKKYVLKTDENGNEITVADAENDRRHLSEIQHTVFP